MEIKGLLLTSLKINQVISRAQELGYKYYNFRNFNPVYIIEFNEQYNGNKKGLLFNCGLDITPLNLLGFGFEGLFTDEEKINQIEQFGKYRCSVEEVDGEYDCTLIQINS